MGRPISYQTGISEYNQNLSQYTGMLGGLTADIHTLKSLKPLTTNRVIVVMHRGPRFLMHYFGGKNAYSQTSPFATYKKIIEYYNTGISVGLNDRSLGSASLQGGVVGRTIPIPTVQNAQSTQTLTINVPEQQGRPMADVHNMWIEGISDSITGYTTYHGQVGSPDANNIVRRLYPSTNADRSDIALEPSPAWEVAEFLIIAVGRSGATVEGALMALGCVPQSKVGDEIFNSNATGSSELVNYALTYNCQYIESKYVQDLAQRYLNQFAILGHSLNLNPGAGDAFFNSASSLKIDTPMFNNGQRPTLDAVQSGLGNAPVFTSNNNIEQREPIVDKTLTPADHSRIYTSNDTTAPIENPYTTT